ncbi:ABC transporter substrate-binding protein [Agathobaculum sp. NTUH-O15-33]|uniref:ABC transporter substrate-binding protein n=1 Tax=Agathobaculum sp. NTUH-O15-33 TaxID=3079302 RepID=UPI00295841EA|nr:ABC transporter substrate-binding protein [Agathobaculum sp. NTUH-O15-33]WNX84839.1 ABC transporter substrate-binding protein [Agathobaculum sp. NTUH-O15-33]
MGRSFLKGGVLLGALLALLLLGTGCGNGQSAPELYLDESIPETPIKIFTQNQTVSKAIEACCKNVLNQDKSTNIVVYSDSASFYADEGLSYRELLLKRLASGTADDLYLIPAEDVLEFDEKGYIYDMSNLNCTANLSQDALIQSTYNGKVFSVPLTYTCFGFVWNVDMLKKYGLEVPENLAEFLHVCETLKENGVLPYGANKDFSLTVPVMCAGLYDIYQGENTEQTLALLSDGTVSISEYMEKGFSFLQMLIDNGYMDPEAALGTLPSSKEEKAFFQEENCAFICAIYRGQTFEDYPFEIEMTPLPILENGSICVVGADQRLAINPGSEHLDAAIAIVEALGETATLDSFAEHLGKISSSQNATAPNITQSKSIIACVSQGGQIPNQDFRLHFNVWNTVRELSQRLCQGASVAEVTAEYDARQKQEVSLYGEH